MREKLRAYLPAALLFAVFLALWAFGPAAALAAPSNPAQVTTTSCTFGTTWFDGLSRWLFGISLVLMLLAGLLALRNLHTEGPWGGIIAIAGVGILLGIVGQLPNLAPIALAASGAPACP